VHLGWGLAFGADLAAGGSFLLSLLLAKGFLLLTFESFLLGLLLLSS
jgi:hypothetical protein